MAATAHMAVPLSVLLILTGITGTHCISTVSKVSVKAGASVSIPCLYNTQYRNHVKYLCMGYFWSTCTYATKTNQPQSSGKFLITDDKEQTTFTVTIKQLTEDETDFWCGVEINNGPDVKIYFQLSITEHTPRLYVDHQKVTGFVGEHITINCSYRISGEIKWCRLSGECVKKSSGVIEGTTVTINESVPDVFAVNMSGLRPENSGWYFCSKGDFQMPVHINVTEKLAATSKTVTEDGVTTTIPSVTMAKNKENSAPFDLVTLVIPLGALVLIVIVVLFIWIMLKQRSNSSSVGVEKSRTNSKASKSNEEEVTYSDVICKRKHSVQRPCGESDADVTYSSVVMVKKQNVKRNEEKEEDVTYSTLTKHQ